MKKVLFTDLTKHDGMKVSRILAPPLNNSTLWLEAGKKFDLEPWIDDDPNYAKGFIFHDDEKYLLYLLSIR